MVQPNQFIFGGKSSLNYRLYITEPGVFSVAEPNITEQTVPGRNGTLAMFDGSYKNRSVQYKTWLDISQIDERSKWRYMVSTWLLSSPGVYRELCDSYERTYCKMAYYSGGLNMDASDTPVLQQTLTFSCKPFQYERAGLHLREIDNDVTFINSHLFPASPYIRITGSGTVTLGVGDNSWQFDVDDYIEIDSERMSTYKGTELQNNHKHGNGYPQLGVGRTHIMWSGGTVQKVELMPRWCTL